MSGYAGAMRWYRRAAEQGDAAAQTLLGIYCFSGQGVPQNYVLGHIWLNLASANGLDQARETRDILEEQMTRDQIVDAQARAQDSISSEYQDCD